MKLGEAKPELPWQRPEVMRKVIGPSFSMICVYEYGEEEKKSLMTKRNDSQVLA